MGERAEQRLVEQLITQTAIEALDKRVLLRFARRDVVPCDMALLGPAQDRRAGQLGAVVGDTGGRLAAFSNNRIEHAPDPQARQRGIGDQRQTLAGEIVDDGENAEVPAVTELVVQKIHRPARVWALWQGQRCPGAEGPLATAATANLKPFLGVDPTQLLVVQSEALAPQQDVQSAIAKAPPHRGDLPQTGSQQTIVWPPAAIADRAAVRADRLACPPLAHPVPLVEVSGGFASGGVRHHFLAATSRNMALSSIASTNSFFSLAFSSSSAFAAGRRRPPS